MKKLFFAFMTIGVLASATSCKKCGYCRYPNGSVDSSVCQGGTVIPGVPSEYDQAKSNCTGPSQGTWVVTK